VKIIIDGDSTPNKKEIIDTAKKYGIKAVIVLSTEHFSEKLEYSYAETVLVDNRPQEADIKIMNLAEAYDIVLTNDMSLSFMLQGKKVTVINSRGMTVSKKDMSLGLEILHEEKKMRRSGKIKRTGISGPKKYKEEDVKQLIKSLEKAIAEGGKN
jgi:uncharacterized protein YaiI (UPF0178 family)